MKLPFKISCVMIVIVVCVVLCYAIYLWATYINETITSGEGYGFKIGDSKEQVYHKAAELFKNNRIFFLHPLDERGFGPHKQIRFGNQEYELIKDRDEWKLYFDENYFNLISLKFKGGYLVEIYRHRKKFELP